VRTPISRNASTGRCGRWPALQHPNFCQLYDIGPNFLVIEFVDGAPLKGPLPVEKAVEYAGQILDASTWLTRTSLIGT